MKVFVLLVAFLFYVSFSHAHSSGSDEIKCLQVVSQIQKVNDLDILYACTEFFWHNGKHDNFSFNNVIDLGKRIVEINPQDLGMTTNVIWLLYSKWSTWNKNPENMPDGELKVEEAFAFIRATETKNKMNADFYLQVALQIEPILRHYRHDLIPFGMDYYKRVTVLIPRSSPRESLVMRLRAELNLGHWSSFKNRDLDGAIYWYQEALKTDPNNNVAKRRLNELVGSHAP